jgi:tetratricopeptide (TPR) repeat protein
MRNITKKVCAYLLLMSCFACRDKHQPLVAGANLADLKRGEIVSCGPQDGEMFGNVSFTASVAEKWKKDFNIAIALLHSFEYDEAEKMFAKVIDNAPDCAMAYWGVAMSNFHPLWAPPTEAELKKGTEAIKIAQSITNKTKREADYIEAVARFYERANQVDHHTRVLNFEKAMEKIYSDYPDDPEAPVFYALALNAAADPTDKTYKNQRKAIEILLPLFEKQPLHPGLAHYIIHSSDYPELAKLGLNAARKYASIAPASAHAQHMPSHIFTRLGLWDECIKSNLVSVSSAQCYADKANIKGHWDEELHGLDYLVYAYLQKGNDQEAKEQFDYLSTINLVYPVNFKTAYAFAAIPGRYFLEKRMWNQASQMQIHPANYPWEKFPWQKAIYHFARSLGSVNSNNLTQATIELDSLNFLHNVLLKQKDKAKEAEQVNIQIKTCLAWIEFKKGNNKNALLLMQTAADMEDKTEKHPVTPGEVIPARELLGDMLLQMNKYNEALNVYEEDLKTHPNRFNGLYGAAMAAEKSGNTEKAVYYYKQLSVVTNDVKSNRPELAHMKMFMESHKN